MAGNDGRAGGRIVVGVDGTATSAAAVRWAIREARLRQASLHLVSAADSRQGGRAAYAPAPGPPRPEADNPLGAALHAAEQQAIQALPAARLSSELADGPPARVLIDRSVRADLLVLGSAYQEGQATIQAPPVMGPVARACLQRAACPVVFVSASSMPGTISGRRPPSHE